MFADVKLEICTTSNGYPPGESGRVQTNGVTRWARIPGGPWRRLTGSQSLWRAKQEASLFDSASEALEWLCGDGK